MTVPTYDQGRKDAPLRVCATCGRTFAMLHPLPSCIGCDRAAAVSACRQSDGETVRKSA